MKRCDSRCWTADEPICDCICDGVFHGTNGTEARAYLWQKYGQLPRTPKQVHLAIVLLNQLGMRPNSLPSRKDGFKVVKEVRHIGPTKDRGPKLLT